MLLFSFPLQPNNQSHLRHRFADGVFYFAPALAMISMTLHRITTPLTLPATKTASTKHQNQHGRSLIICTIFSPRYLLESYKYHSRPQQATYPVLHASPTLSINAFLGTLPRRTMYPAFSLSSFTRFMIL